VLFDSQYWGDLVDWISDELTREKMISSGDLDLLMLTDDPARAVDHVVDCYERLRRPRASSG
jgi:hypothetical protein